MDAKPDVFAHNLETVRRLTPSVRDKRASYDQSLAFSLTPSDARPSATRRRR